MYLAQVIGTVVVAVKPDVLKAIASRLSSLLEMTAHVWTCTCEPTPERCAPFTLDRKRP